MRSPTALEVASKVGLGFGLMLAGCWQPTPNTNGTTAQSENTVPADKGCRFHESAKRELEHAGFVDFTGEEREMFLERAGDLAGISAFKGERLDWHYAIPMCREGAQLPEPMPRRLAIILAEMRLSSSLEYMTVFDAPDDAADLVVERRKGYYLVYFVRKGNA